MTRLPPNATSQHHTDDSIKAKLCHLPAPVIFLPFCSLTQFQTSSGPVASLSATTTSAPTTNAATATTTVVVIKDEDNRWTDHALPLEDDPTVLSHLPIWTLQTQQSTYNFIHTIMQPSQKQEYGCKKAQYSATNIWLFGVIVGDIVRYKWSKHKKMLKKKNFITVLDYFRLII